MIGKCATKNRNAAAVKWVSKQIDWQLSENTVCSIETNYYEEVKRKWYERVCPDQVSVTTPFPNVWMPVLLGEKINVYMCICKCISRFCERMVLLQTGQWPLLLVRQSPWRQTEGCFRSIVGLWRPAGNIPRANQHNCWVWGDPSTVGDKLGTEKEDTKLVEIGGLDDKHQIIAVFVGILRWWFLFPTAGIQRKN